MKKYKAYMRTWLAQTFTLLIEGLGQLRERLALDQSATVTSPPQLFSYGNTTYARLQKLSAQSQRVQLQSLLEGIAQCACAQATLRCNSCVERVFRARWLSAALLERQGTVVTKVLHFHHRIMPILVPAHSFLTPTQLREMENFNSLTLLLVDHLKEIA